MSVGERSGALAPGSRVGPYEVMAPLGEGGMGKVWRARHTALKRDDALKVLPDAFATDPDRRARFQREAQVLTSLNHPNIAHVYGLEEAPASSGQAAIKALVMELVEGPTLAERIAQGAIPIEEALPIAKQIAEALEAAHERGIIHRDLNATRGARSSAAEPRHAVARGGARPVASRVFVPTGNFNNVAMSGSAGLLAYRSHGGVARLIWVDRSGRRLSELGEPDSARPADLAGSPTGSLVAMQRTVDGNADVWVLDTERGVQRRLTFGDERDGWPVWSPDGRRVAFSAERTGVFDLFERPADGSGGQTALLSSPEPKFADDWSPDGRNLLFNVQSREGARTCGCSRSTAIKNPFRLPRRRSRRWTVVSHRTDDGSPIRPLKQDGGRSMSSPFRISR